MVFGTRPEAIKLAPVILALKRNARLICKVCVTAQHREMLDQVLTLFGIKPDVDLGLMRPNQTLSDLTARIIGAIDEFYAKERPDLVLVQGDTTTTFCASLVAFYNKVPVGHVEAGLRTGNYSAPWPEEANRVITSRLALLHFAPTEINRQNLIKEGVPDERIYVTGNTIIDALYLLLDRAKSMRLSIPGLSQDALHNVGKHRLILITGHRRENFGLGLESVCRAIAELATRYPDCHFVYPVHLNPNVREPVDRILKPSALQNVHLVEPLRYLEFVAMMAKAFVILTDSGGIQEEATSLGKPVLVMRDTTERPEAIAAGNAKLIGSDFDRIVTETSRLLSNESAYRSMARSSDAYGDGNAAEKTVTACVNYLNEASPIRECT